MATAVVEGVRASMFEKAGESCDGDKGGAQVVGDNGEQVTQFLID
jgi:hypothetical protein